MSRSREKFLSLPKIEQQLMTLYENEDVVVMPLADELMNNKNIDDTCTEELML